MKKFPKIPGSVVMMTLKKFLLDERNTNQIYQYMKFSELINISKVSILKILNFIRRVIEHYLKDI